MKTARVPFDFHLPASLIQASIKAKTFIIAVIRSDSGHDLFTPEPTARMVEIRTRYASDHQVKLRWRDI